MDTAMESWPQRHRITVDEYYRMAEIGVLAPNARVELIEGEIIDMAPIGSEHASVVDQLTHLLVRAAGDRAIVRVQGSVEHPHGADILLLVEVADSALHYDRDIKAPLYARYGVAEVWIVDLQHDCLLAYRDLANGQYRTATSTPRPGLTALTSLPGVAIDLGKLFDA